MTIEVRRVYRCSDVVGMLVKTPEGQQIGKIEEVVIDLEHYQLAYAVMSFGGFLGYGAKLMAVPWRALTMRHDAQDCHFVLDVEPEALKKIPGFDDTDWPDVADPDWRAEIDRHFRPEPSMGDTHGSVDLNS